MKWASGTWQMNRCIIIGGAEIKNYDLIREYFKPGDYFVYCDCGLKHEKFLRVKPDLIIGDFDSYAQPLDLHNVIVLPKVKDDTDTIFAVKEGIKRGFDDFVLIGATGGRQDHNLGNIYALLMLKMQGKSAIIIDDYSEIKIIAQGETERVKFGCKFFSVINIAGIARGITITGAKYNLDNAEISPEYQYGISNEVLENEAIIELGEGYLLLIIVRSHE